MAVRYASAWLNHWQGVDIDAVKADWANELGGVSAAALKFGIVNLPIDRPPTVGQFKEICRRAPQLQAPLIVDAVKANPERVNAIVGRLRGKLTKRDRLQWAYDLQDREKRGEDLTIAQQNAWRDALVTVPPDNMTFANIDPACLPPAMRPAQQDAAYQRAESQALDQFHNREFA
jgi:hypothetical protein